MGHSPRAMEVSKWQAMEAGHCEAGGVEQIQDDIWSPVMLMVIN